MSFIKYLAQCLTQTSKCYINIISIFVSVILNQSLLGISLSPMRHTLPTLKLLKNFLKTHISSIIPKDYDALSLRWRQVWESHCFREHVWQNMTITRTHKNP